MNEPMSTVGLADMCPEYLGFTCSGTQWFVIFLNEIIHCNCIAISWNRIYIYILSVYRFIVPIDMYFLCCKECPPFRYGDNCNEVCDCNVKNTKSCDQHTGACVCKEGFVGELCTCKAANHECDQTTSSCDTSNGKPTCVCKVAVNSKQAKCTGKYY